MSTLEILVYLYVHGSVGKTQLSTQLRRNHETIEHALMLLRELGLVELQRESSFPFRELHELSHRGKRLVESPLYMWPSLSWEWTGFGLLPSPAKVRMPTPHEMR